MLRSIMHSVVVSQSPPWPIRSGNQQRISNVIDALGTYGTVEVRTVLPRSVLVDGAHPKADSDQVIRFDRAQARMAKVGWLVYPRCAPSHVGLPKLSWGQNERTPDVVWYSRPRSWLLMPPPTGAGTVIVDFDDIEYLKLEQDEGNWSTLVKRIRTKTEIRGWQRLYSRIATQVDAVAVCSPEDQQRLGLDNAIVVPNTSPKPSVSWSPGTEGAKRVIALAGNFQYRPNRLGVDWFLTQVMPIIRLSDSDVEVRISGRGSASLLGGHGVTLVGELESLEPELAKATIAVVPVHIGSGTRLKILQAFAVGVPVVSTSVGADGLEVVDGETLMIGDSAEAFAQRCLDLLKDQKLQSVLSENAHRLWADQYGPQALMTALDGVTSR